MEVETASILGPGGKKEAYAARARSIARGGLNTKSRVEKGSGKSLERAPLTSSYTRGKDVFGSEDYKRIGVENSLEGNQGGIIFVDLTLLVGKSGKRGTGILKGKRLFG